MERSHVEKTAPGCFVFLNLNRKYECIGHTIRDKPAAPHFPNAARIVVKECQWGEMSDPVKFFTLDVQCGRL
jgi:hypothetical protein